MQFLFNRLVLPLAQLAVFLANNIPRRITHALMLSLVKAMNFFRQRYYRVGMRNLERAYPEKDTKWKKEILRSCDSSIAHLLLDFARTDTINANNVHLEFEFPFQARLQELKNAGTPVIYAMGHLGSFELLAHFIAVTGYPFSFVARKFKVPTLDRWWTERRERSGNTTIPREGALRGVLKNLKAHREVAVLFDQNITRKSAAFVPWFDMPAATTKLIGVAAIQTRAVVVLLSMKSLGNGKYRAITKERDFTHIYDSAMTREAQIQHITEEISKDYVAMIRENPGAWFWGHRRWKTTPEGVPENFYDNL